jgi:predicted Zn-dependent protease
MRRVFACAFSAFFLLSCCLAGAQDQYSEKDKKKLAEIAERPEVQKEIETQWEAIQRKDLEFAYSINRSIEVEKASPTAFAEYRSKYGELYDNPLLEQYVNVLGQRLIPRNSNNLYAFRILLDPVPRAEALSTGTVYISTGLVSLLDNEAQLSYVLAHEIAHVEKAHQYNVIRNSILDEKLAEEHQADATKKRAIFSAITAAAGAGIGGLAGGANGAMAGALLGGVGGLVTSSILIRNRFDPTNWSKLEEDEADTFGLQYMLQQNYDAREVPRMLARLDKLTTEDSRVGLGFIGSKRRVQERIEHISEELKGEDAALIQQRLASGGLKGSSPEFAVLMATLKRDNGIQAMQYDLFAMAKDNLQDAVSLRSNDPRAQTFLGELLATTAQTPEDRQDALNHIMLAIKYDAERGAYPEPHLDNAVMLLSSRDANMAQTAQKEIKAYIALYQREHAGAIPPNVHVLYDYLTDTGDQNWYMPPASSITTRNTGSVGVVSTSASSPNATELVNTSLTNNSTTASASEPQTQGAHAVATGTTAKRATTRQASYHKPQ